MRKNTTLYCSFCGKSQHEVRKLIAGPKVFICNECTVLCMQIIDEDNKSVFAKSRDGVPTPDEISNFLKGYVEAQDHVRSVLSQVLHRHFRRLLDAENGRRAAGPPPHMLLNGSSLDRAMVARAVSRLDIPVVALGATKLVEVGDASDISRTIALELLEVADYNLPRAMRGIVFIDDFDRLGGTRDASMGCADLPAQSVQSALMDVMSGTIVEVHSEHKGGGLTVDTSALTVICGGLFTNLSRSGTAKTEGQAGIQRSGRDDTGDLRELPSLSDDESRRFVDLGFSSDLVHCFAAFLNLS